MLTPALARGGAHGHAYTGGPRGVTVPRRSPSRSASFRRRPTGMIRRPDRCYTPRHIAGHIQRGEGTGPTKPRQPPSCHSGKVPIPDRCVAGPRALRHTVTAKKQRERVPQWLSVIFSARSARRATRSTPSTCASAASARSRSATTTARLGARHRRAAPAHPGGSPEHLALRRLPAARRRAPRAVGAAHLAGRAAGRLHAAGARRPARRALGLSEVWVKNDAANPTHSFKDRVVSVAVSQGPRARLRDDRLRLDRQPRQLGGRPRGRPGAELLRASSRPTSRSRRCSPPASTGPPWWASRATTTTSTACAPSCAPRRTGRSSTSTCAPTTPRAPRRSPSRSPSSSAGSSPTAAWCRSPPARCTPKSRRLRASGASWACSRASCREMNGAQAEGCSPVVERVRRRRARYAAR